MVGEQQLRDHCRELEERVAQGEKQREGLVAMVAEERKQRAALQAQLDALRATVAGLQSSKADRPELGAVSDALHDSWFKMALALLDDSAPRATLTPLKARSRRQQPHAAPHQLGSQRNRKESGWKGGSK